MAALAQMQTVETRLLQLLCHTSLLHIFVIQQEEVILHRLQESRVSINAVCNNGWQLHTGVSFVAGPGQPNIGSSSN